MLFRVLIPRAPSASTFQGESELAGFLSGLHILLAGRREITGRIVSAIGNPSDSVIHETADAVELLVKAEKESDLDVMIIDQRLIGHEPDAFLRALMKLRPQAGIVVLKDEHAVDSLQSRGVITIPASATPTIVAGAIIEAKGLAHRPR
jgi:hypothetical protein